MPNYHAAQRALDFAPSATGRLPSPSEPSVLGRKFGSGIDGQNIVWRFAYQVARSLCVALLAAFLFAASAHAEVEYGFAWGGFYVAPVPDTRTACKNAGGDFVVGNGCVFETGPAACKAVIAYWKTLPPGNFYEQFEFVSHGVPYTDPFGNQLYRDWCILSSTLVPGPGPFTLNGSSYPAISASPVVRCAPGSARNTDWRGYVPENPASVPVCTNDTPPKNKDCCGEGCAGNPINVSTGNKAQRESDFVGAGSTLSFSRTFNLIEPQAKSSLGYGWTHTYSRWVKASSALPKATIRRHDGREFVFNFNATNSVWTADADVTDRLTELKDGAGVRTGWQLITASDEVESYDAAGKLTAIVDRSGRTQSLTYSDASTSVSIAPTPGLLIRVTDSFGRQLNFTYDGASRIATMQAPDGGVYTYAYTPYTYLSVNYDHLSSVTHPGGAIKTYLYENNQYNNAPHALTGITDENNSRFATWTYDIDGRAVSSKHGATADYYTITRTRDASFNTTSAIVTDPLGTARTYNFQTILGVVKTTGVSQPCPSCGGAQSQVTTYDTNGNVASRTDFNNKKVCYAYDLARNLETTRVEGLLSSESCTTALTTPPNRPDVRKTVTTWHATYRLPLTITEPAAAATVGGTAGTKLTEFTHDSAGNVLTKKVIAPKNDGSGTSELRTWTWTYNALGQVLTSKDPLNKTTTTVYYAATDTVNVPPLYTMGDVQTVTNALSHVTTFNEYDKNGRLTKLTDANGLVTTMTYHPRGWLTARSVNNGTTTETTTYTYDNVGQLTRVTLPDGSALNYAYDAAHRLVGMSDGNALANGQLANLTGNKIIYTLDNMGNRVREDHFGPGGGLAKRKQRAIDSLNRLKQDIGGTSYATAAPVGAPTVDAGVASPPANAAVTQYGYDNNGNLTTTLDPLGRQTSNEYDALNRLSKVIDPYNGASKPTQYTYDSAGNLVRVTDPQGLATDYTYNGHNNLITQTSPDTGATKFTYDPVGNVVTKFDAEGRCNLTTYDALNRVSAIRYFASSNASTNTATGCAAATTSTTTVEETIAYTYDSITATLGGPGGTGRLSRVSDAGGRIDYLYDKNGRITSKAQVTTGATNDTKTVTYSYNAFGQLSQMITPSGQTITYFYGNATGAQPGKLVQIRLNIALDIVRGAVYAPFGPNGGWVWGNDTVPLAGPVPGSAIMNHHLRVFDDDYRPTAIASDPEGYNRDISWDRANRITGITVPGTSGGVPTITIPGLSNALSVNQSYGYDALDRLTQFGAGYPGAATAATGQGMLPGETFTFDAIGNRLTRTATPPGGSASTATYAYPNLTSTPGSKRHTLTSITGAQVNAYTYDATGNTKTESAALGAAINPVTGTALAQTYDARNRLKTVQVGTNAADTVSYQVNALGQRVQKLGAGQFTYNSSDVLAPSTGLSPQAVTLAYNARYVYDEQGRLLGEYSLDGKLIQETIWFDDLPVATIRPKGASNQRPLGIAGTGKGTANNGGANSVANSVNVEVFYLHPDHLGTPRVATRSVEAGGATTGPNAINKAVWTWDSDPFGSSIGNSKPNENPQNVTGRKEQITAASFRVNHRFPGQLADAESGKYYNYFRDYDPSIGRYTESDPIGLKGGKNTFGYVKQRPTRKIDPKGLFTSDVHFRACEIAGIQSGCKLGLGYYCAMGDWYPSWSTSQSTAAAHQHFMCQPNEAPAVGYGNAVNFMAGEIMKCTRQGLGNAIHALQDSCARGHMGCHPYNHDDGFNATHFFYDFFPSLDAWACAIKAAAIEIALFKKHCPCAQC